MRCRVRKLSLCLLSFIVLSCSLLPNVNAKADGDGAVTIPFNYYLNHIFIPVKINGRGPYPAVLDTGGRLLITPDFAHYNKISSYGQVYATGIGRSTAYGKIANVSDIEIGTVEIKNPTVCILPLPTISFMIGYELFKNFVVQIDFDKSLVTLTPFRNFSYAGTGTIVPFSFYGHAPEVNGTIDGISGQFSIDTGSDDSLDLFPSYIRKNDLMDKIHPPVAFASSVGIGGSLPASVGRGSTFAVGGVEEHNILVRLFTPTSGSYSAVDIDGNIGTGFLRRFNLTFNYAKKQIIFEPNSHFSDPDDYERLGAAVEVGPQGILVEQVLPGSPADSAGIHQGDLILMVNGREVSADDTEYFFGQIMRPTGTSLDIQVQHGKQIENLTVTLKDLV